MQQRHTGTDRHIARLRGPPLSKYPQPFIKQGLGEGKKRKTSKGKRTTEDGKRKKRERKSLHCKSPGLTQYPPHAHPHTVQRCRRHCEELFAAVRPMQRQTVTHSQPAVLPPPSVLPVCGVVGAVATRRTASPRLEADVGVADRCQCHGCAEADGVPGHTFGHTHATHAHARQRHSCRRPEQEKRGQHTCTRRPPHP